MASAVPVSRQIRVHKLPPLLDPGTHPDRNPDWAPPGKALRPLCLYKMSVLGHFRIRHHSQPRLPLLRCG
jgi:hypothetical protein